MIVIEPLGPLGQYDPGQRLTQEERYKLRVAIEANKAADRARKEEAERARQQRIAQEEALNKLRQPTTALEAEGMRRMDEYNARNKFNADRRAFENELSTASLATKAKVHTVMKVFDSYEALPGYAAFSQGRTTVAEMLPAILDIEEQLMAQAQAEREAKDQLPPGFVSAEGASPIPSSQAKKWWASTDRERAEWGAKAILKQMRISYTKGKTIITTQQADQILKGTLRWLEAVASDPAFVTDPKDLRDMQIVMGKVNANLLGNMGISVGAEKPEWHERVEAAVVWWLGRTREKTMDSNRYAEYFRQVANTAKSWWKRDRDIYIRKGGVVDSPQESIVKRYVDNLLRESISVEIVPTKAEREKALQKAATDLYREEQKVKWAAWLAEYPKLPGSPPVIKAIVEISDKMQITPGELDPGTYKSLRSAVYERGRRLSGEFFYYEYPAGKRAYKTDRVTVSQMLAAAGYTKAAAAPKPLTVLLPRTPTRPTASPNDPAIQEAIQMAISEAGLQSGQEVISVAAFERLVMEKAALLAPRTGKAARAVDVISAVKARMRYVLAGAAM